MRGVLCVDGRLMTSIDQSFEFRGMQLRLPPRSNVYNGKTKRLQNLHGSLEKLRLVETEARREALVRAASSAVPLASDPEWSLQPL